MASGQVQCSGSDGRQIDRGSRLERSDGALPLLHGKVPYRGGQVGRRPPLPQQGESLLKDLDWLAHLHAEGMRVPLGLAATEAEEGPAAGEAVQGGDRGGEQVGMAEIRIRHAGAEANVSGFPRQGSQQRKRVPAVRILAHPEGIDSRLVRDPRHLNRPRHGCHRVRCPCPGVIGEIQAEPKGQRSHDWSFRPIRSAQR